MAKLKPWQRTNKVPLDGKYNNMKSSKKPKIGTSVRTNINNMLWYLDLQYLEFHSYKILDRIDKDKRNSWERLYYFPNEKYIKYRTSKEICYGYRIGVVKTTLNSWDHIDSWDNVPYYEQNLPLDKEILETIKYILLEHCKLKAKEERIKKLAIEERDEINNYLKERGITND